MYNTFDRSCYPYAKQLGTAALTWLIDGRGQQPAYAESALKALPNCASEP